MATSKRYRYNSSNFAFPAVIGGKQRWLRFLGAKSNEGYYTTQDADEQAAIEHSKRYKRGEIRLVGSYEVADENEELGEEVAETVVTVEPTTVEVSTVQEAREWLLANREAKQSDLPNKEAVMAYAANHSVKFVGI